MRYFALAVTGSRLKNSEMRRVMSSDTCATLRS